jgi:hypothetical protein
MDPANRTINRSKLDPQLQALWSFSERLSPNAQVRLSSCFAALGAEGKQFLQDIAYWLDAKVEGNAGEVAGIGLGSWWEAPKGGQTQATKK